jgi:hypothetical protein
LGNDRVIIIATREHLDQLNHRLQQQFTNLHAFIENQQYIPIEVNDLLTLIMPDQQFDEERFIHFISGKLHLNRFPNGVRVFSEMVTTLIANKVFDVVLHLDRAWDILHSRFRFSHFRAFPVSSIETENAPLNFYDENAFLIMGISGSTTDITYRQYSRDKLKI